MKRKEKHMWLLQVLGPQTCTYTDVTVRASLYCEQRQVHEYIARHRALLLSASGLPEAEGGKRTSTCPPPVHTASGRS